MDSKGLQELTDIYLKEISADTALRASKEADKARGKAAAGGDREKAKAKAAQASRLYKASAEKRKKEPVATPDRSYPKGKGASYQEDKDWGYDKDGNSLNPVDIEKREREDDDLAGAPNKKKGKKAKKDYDGDGKIESGTDEYLGSKDKAIKKAMKKESHEKVTALRGLVEKKKDSYKTVAAVIDYDRSKKGTDDATYDSEHGEDEKAKKERDYAAFERGKMKKDDPNWKHKKGSTSEEVESLKRLIESGKFSDKEIETMAWDIYEGISASGYARAKKYREDQAREKNRRENPQQAEFFREVDKIKAAKAKRKDKAEKNLASNMKKENYQAMRNPEKEEKKDKRSAREKRMADPEKGINSPAFKEFMRQQGM